MTLNLLFNISEIAIITGDNPYKSKRDFLIDYWKKHYKSDFEECQKAINYINKETDEEVIQKISNKNSFNIESEMKKCSETNNLETLNETKKIIMEKVKNVSEEEKKEITKSITNLTNTKFGIKNEFDVTKIYENIKSCNVIKDDIYRKKKIIVTEKYSVCIGGKIDGINLNENCIIEVKNRMTKMFYELRNYEKVQIMCYIYLFGKEKGHLVEALRKKIGTEINIINVEFDNEYINYIIDKIKIFSEYFYNFINNHDEKIRILSNNEGNIY
jgi:hypothetical protein